MDPTIKDFESAIAELETIVKTLEEGDLALEKSLALFERGVQLSRFCHAKLEEAERRVEVLNERGEIKPAPPALAGDGATGDRGRGFTLRRTRVGRHLPSESGSTRAAPKSTRHSNAPCPRRPPVPRAWAKRCATACSPAASGCVRCSRLPP